MKYCFGADVGGTTIKLGLFTVDGEILDKWEIITRTENEGESILQDIATALKEKIQEKAIPAEEVIGIGMGIPAPVNSEGIVRKTANLGWGYKEVKKRHSVRCGKVLDMVRRIWSWSHLELELAEE